MKKGKTFMFLNVKRVVNVTALSLLLTTSLFYAKDKNSQNNWTDKQIAKLMNNAEYKEEFINNFKEEIKKTESFKQLDDEDKQGFLSVLDKEIFPSVNKIKLKGMLDLDFSELDKKYLLEKFPDIYAGIPKVSVQELLDLSNMKSEDIEKAIQEYLKTGKIEEKYKFIITDELISIIKEKESIIKRGIIAEQGIQKAEQGIQKAEQGIQKAEQGIQKIKELNKRFNEIMKGIKKTLKSGGIPLKKE